MGPTHNSGYHRRAADRLIAELLDELSALLIVGPRASGKTTTASRHAATVVRLDMAKEAAAFRADPDAALRGLEEPILLDEWQVVPEVLGAVKRTVDQDGRPGRFLLTGSVRADLEAATWPGTGRLVRVALFGMTVAEQLRRVPPVPFVDRFARGEAFSIPKDTPDLRGYVEIALRGGFPEPALSLSDRARLRWLDAYVDQLLTRDSMRLAAGRDPDKLRRFFEAYALCSAGVVAEKKLLESAGINRKTARSYEQLLINLMVAHRVPAWNSNRLKRLVRSPKRYLIDPGLLVGALRLDTDAVMRDGDLLGSLLDTFVAAQLRSDLTVAASRPRLYHLRTECGRHEVDLIVELGGGRVVGLEVKAASAPTSEAARHLRWLRDKLGDRFLKGLVLHTGPNLYQLDDGIWAAPISTFWS